MLYNIPDEILTTTVYSFLNQEIIYILVSINTSMKTIFINEYQKHLSALLIQKYYRYYKPKLPYFNNWSINSISTNNKAIITRIFITNNLKHLKRFLVLFSRIIVQNNQVDRKMLDLFHHIHYFNRI